jgi:selenocysteine-specific elongation factor
MSRAAIIGTAGHIDHGKTQLIRMLTGVDTDRLKEEKRRGISIELGFTSLDLPSGRRCGVIDVPGHERFIRNMLAGAGGIDLILFVVAADEGVMPQTREHMDIIQLLGVRRGVVALTKVDLVDPEWLELVTADVRDYLGSTVLTEARIVPISSVTGQGKDEVLRAMDEELERLETIRRGRFGRLPVDRVFTMPGFGTVVTGTLWGGRLEQGGRVHIQPRGLEARIKALEVHNRPVPEALAGHRVAVCLHNISRGQISRGDWLVVEEDLHPVTKMDVRLHAIRDLAKPMTNRLRIRFYLGASEVMGRVLLLDRDELGPGEDALAQIQLERPTVAERGDRFVIRSFSPMRTLGGGEVIDVSGTRRRRYRKEDLDALRVSEEGTIEDRILGIVGRPGGLGFSEADLTQKLGQPPAEVHESVEALVSQGRMIRVGKTRLVTPEEYDAVGRTLETAVLEHEKEHPLRYGPLKSELKSRYRKSIHADVAEAWIQQALADGKLHARGDRLRRSGAAIELPPRLSALRERMLEDLRARAFAGPTQKEFLQAYGDDRDAGEMLQLILGEETAVRIGADILLLAGVLPELRARTLRYFESKSEMSVADLKEVLGVSRKQGVPLLEYMDRRQWTVRQGDVRTAGPRLRD